MQHIIMGPQPHIIGMPEPIMVIMVLQHCMNMSLDMPAMGVISQTMPVSVILQVMVPIIMGIMPPIIIGFMPAIMGFIPIIGIAFMPIIGFIMGMAFIIGMGLIIGIELMAVIGIAFIGRLR